MTPADQLALIRRMPHPVAKAAAHGILALLDQRPDLRRTFSGPDIALLESFRRPHDEELDRLLGD
jgi:hypothetical protein